MPAKLSAFPQNVIFDLSPRQSVGVATQTAAFFNTTTTGTKGLMIDGDLTTSYKIVNSCSHTPITDAAIITVVFDYGMLFFNNQISYKVTFFSQPQFGGLQSQYTIDYSNDGSNWTNIESAETTGTTTTALTKSLTTLSARYLRFQHNTKANSIADQQHIEIELFEVRLMGSGK